MHSFIRGTCTPRQYMYIIQCIKKKTLSAIFIVGADLFTFVRNEGGVRRLRGIIKCASVTNNGNCPTKLSTMSHIRFGYTCKI